MEDFSNREAGKKWPRSEEMGGPTRAVKIPLEYVGRDSAGPLGEVVLLNGWSGSEVPLYFHRSMNHQLPINEKFRIKIQIPIDNIYSCQSLLKAFV